jgi:hypothetical protein
MDFGEKQDSLRMCKGTSYYDEIEQGMNLEEFLRSDLADSDDFGSQLLHVMKS